MKKLLLLISLGLLASCGNLTPQRAPSNNEAIQKQGPIDQVDATTSKSEKELNSDTSSITRPTITNSKQHNKEIKPTHLIKSDSLLESEKNTGIIHVSPNQAILDSIKESKLKNKR